jgi:hypothetical protein
MKNLKTPTELKKAGYTGIKVSSILNAITSNEIKKHMRLVQNNTASIIKNKYQRNNYISKAEMSYIWTLYWNFVLNDFRFDDKKGYKQLTKTFDVVTFKEH